MLMVTLTVLGAGMPPAPASVWAGSCPREKLEQPDPCELPKGVKPAKPTYPDLPNKTRDGLILITHGWNSDPTAWGNALEQKIRDALGDEDANLWDFVVYDWADIIDGNGLQRGACTGMVAQTDTTPKQKWDSTLRRAECARRNAEAIGEVLGPKIHAMGYTRIHFIAHSAGSWLNEVAADKLKAAGSTAEIRQTFLDTYMPLEGVKNQLMGDSAAFAVQYVDKREPQDPQGQEKPFTNADLSNVYNLEVTKLDPFFGKLKKPEVIFLRGHEWPHRWYRETTAEPPPANAHGWGYARALERLVFSNPAGLPAYGAMIDNRQVAKGVRHALPPGQAAQPKNQAPVIPGAPIDFRGSQTSVTGVTIDPMAGTSVILNTNVVNQEPEAWVEQTVSISGSEPANVLQFEYEFSGTGQGWLEVYVDDTLVFDADERYGNTFYSPPWAEEVILGGSSALSPGVHTVYFRLDPFSDDPSFSSSSTVALSNVRLSFADLGDEALIGIVLPLFSVHGLVILALLLPLAAGVLSRLRMRRRFPNGGTA